MQNSTQTPAHPARNERRGVIIRVSDHALLRFFERAQGLPVEQLREGLALELAPLAITAQSIGGGNYAIKSDGLSYVVVGDLGQPDWDYRPVQDVPGESKFAMYPSMPYPQHIRGKRGK